MTKMTRTESVNQHEGIEPSRAPLTSETLRNLTNDVREAVARAEAELREANQQRFLTLRAQLREWLTQNPVLAQYQYQETPVECTAADAAESVTVIFSHAFGYGETHRFVSYIRIRVSPRWVSFSAAVDYVELPEPKPYYIGLLAEACHTTPESLLTESVDYVVEVALRQIRETAQMYELPLAGMLPEVPQAGLPE
jgi:hypothetical protein